MYTADKTMYTADKACISKLRKASPPNFDTSAQDSTFCTDHRMYT